MSASSYDNDEKEQWDSIDKYSMSVIYTASIDVKRRMGAKKRKCEFVNYYVGLICESEIYPSEFIISDNDGHSGVVRTEWLYEAMLLLDDKLKEILILKYWYKLSRSEMAEIVHVSEKTITNRKNRAFEFIKNYRERMLDCDIRGP